MTVDELREALKDVDGSLRVATIGHFGELDRDLDSVGVYTTHEETYRGRKREIKYVTILRLKGMPVSYEEPD